MTLFDEIDSETSTKIVSWIINANMDEDKHPYLNLFINSQGGSIYHGIAIINAMRTSQIPIHTVCIGCASSMAANVFIQGMAGFRYMHKNTSLMFHSARVETSSVPIEQLEIELSSTKWLEDRINEQIAENSGMSVEMIKSEFSAPLDRYIYVDEAIALGLCDVKVL